MLKKRVKGGLSLILLLRLKRRNPLIRGPQEQNPSPKDDEVIFKIDGCGCNTGNMFPNPTQAQHCASAAAKPSPPPCHHSTCRDVNIAARKDKLQNKLILWNGLMQSAMDKCRIAHRVVSDATPTKSQNKITVTI